MKKSRVKARARLRVKREETAETFDKETAETFDKDAWEIGMREMVDSRDETTTAESRHEPDNASRETKQQPPSQGTSPTTPPERRNYNSRVKARARQRLKRDEQKLKRLVVNTNITACPENRVTAGVQVTGGPVARVKRRGGTSR